ncbi:DUF6731 family protein [Abyssicoccus albus]|uniref:Uncharacterized protein n=1 Tax=Abyssicoccus albus TaxID=1817405 RepID=A0A3N5BJF9_9BACL|nr:DUF6731 family protein [Abyssicoccus albus]RPF57763.1 hypothetical protein EDD62_0397 [Abyssicoccus albus]
MGKSKKVTFNIFRTYTEEYNGPDFMKNERYNFYEFIESVQNLANEELFTIYQGEKLILQKVITHEPGFIHIQILKQREFDLPYQIKKNEEMKQTIEDNVINYDSSYEEEEVKLDDDSFLGEVMVLLYDIDNNALVVQSNRNCTSLRGVVDLFSTIYNEKIDKERESEKYTIINLAPILNRPRIDEAQSLEKYTELEIVVEDHDRFKNSQSVIDNDKTLGAQRIKLHYYLNTNDDKKKTLIRDQVKSFISKLSNNNKTITKMNVKGRNSEKDVIEKFELIEERLTFTYTFTSDKDNGTLNAQSIISEMTHSYKNKKVSGLTFRDLTNDL